MRYRGIGPCRSLMRLLARQEAVLRGVRLIAAQGNTEGQAKTLSAPVAHVGRGGVPGGDMSVGITVFTRLGTYF